MPSNIKRKSRKKLSAAKDWEIDFLKFGRESKFFRYPRSLHPDDFFIMAFDIFKSKQQKLWTRLKVSGIDISGFTYAKENLK